MTELIYGFITGIIFGFLLQKGRVIRYDKQIGALLLKDMTIVKFMLTTVIIAMMGVYLLVDLGLTKLSLKATILGGNIIGGLIFGLGWGILGYCPGTQMGALGEGRWDALWGIIGMIFGAALFAEAYPVLKGTVLTWGDFGKITIPQILGVNHWPLIVVIVVFCLFLFRWFERKGL
ncbi:MAG: YeeE/YedE thiosulfate transporter family protein [Syntrophales bacterium]